MGGISLFFKHYLAWLGLAFVGLTTGVLAQSDDTPAPSRDLVSAFEQVHWQQLEEGMEVAKVVTPLGRAATAFRISPQVFEFQLAVQSGETGSRAQQVGEREGAALVVNAGFFAERANGSLYSIGYLRKDAEVWSKGWANAGGIITFGSRSVELTPTHAGIPQNNFDTLQTRPMLIEPGGAWAMGNNINQSANRSLLCVLENGDVLVMVVTRGGLSLFEAGWILRAREEGGFFGCDSAVALDGGGSTQIWYAGDESLSYRGISPVHNFIVVRSREN